LTGRSSGVCDALERYARSGISTGELDSVAAGVFAVTLACETWDETVVSHRAPTAMLLTDPKFWDARNPFVPAPMNVPLLARAAQQQTERPAATDIVPWPLVTS
jgi:hypothetical protein